MTDKFYESKGKLDIATVNGPDFSWAIEEIENNIELMVDRWQVHHYF